MSGEKELSLEEQYIEKAKEYFSDEDRKRLLNDISFAINQVSSIILSALNSGGSEKQINDQIEDSSDYIISELKNNDQFDSLLKLFIHKKIAEYRISIKNKASNLIDSPYSSIEQDPENLEDIVGEIKKHTLLIQKYNTVNLIKYKNDLNEYLELLKTTNNLSAIKGLFDDLKEEYESDLVIISNSMQLVLKLVNIVEQKDKELSSKPNLESELFNDSDEYISNNEIDTINNLIAEMNQLISLFEEKIKEKNDEVLAKEMVSLEIEDLSDKEKLMLEDYISNDDVLKGYINEIFSIDGINKELLTSAIRELYRWIEDTIGDGANIERKKMILRKPFDHIDLTFIKDNKEAVDSFKTIAILLIKKALDNIEDKFIIGSLFPEKYGKNIIEILKDISKKLVTNNNLGNNEAKDKCVKFIEELNKLKPIILQHISENKTLDELFVYHTIPILTGLEVPQNLFKKFKEILNLYYKNEKENMFRIALKTMHEQNKLTLSLIDLQQALSKHNERTRAISKNCLNYIINNLPQIVAQNIIIEEEKRIEGKRQDVPVEEIVNRQFRLSLLSNNKSTGPIDNVLKEAKEKAHKRSPSRRLSSTPISKELSNEVINGYLLQYPMIPDEIKKKIKIFSEYYYESIKSAILKGKNSVNETLA